MGAIEPLEPEQSEPLEPEKVAGKELTPIQFTAFGFWCKHTTMTETVKELAEAGYPVPLGTIRTWRRQPWWDELWCRHMAKSQVDLAAGIMEADEIATKAYKEIMEGKYSNPKMANAAIQGIKMRMEMGPDPLINRKANVQITNKTQINNLVLDPEKFRSLSPAGMLEYAKTGKKPQ